MQKKKFSFAVGALLLSAGAVSAATVTDNLNLRSGPGLSHDVIGAIPAGSDVRVLNCSRSWCRVAFNDTTGFASRRFIFSGGPVYAVRRRPELSHLAPAMVTVMPRPEVLLGLQTRGLVTAAGEVGAAGDPAVTTRIVDANIQAAPKTRLKIVST